MQHFVTALQTYSSHNFAYKVTGPRSACHSAESLFVVNEHNSLGPGSDPQVTGKYKGANI